MSRVSGALGALRPGRRLAVVVAVVAAIAIGVTTAALAAGGGGGGTRHLTAYFTKTVGLYQGNDVRVLGVRIGKIDKLTVQGTKVRVEKTHIVVDEWLATDEPGIYAIGDVVGPPWLAHKASHEGVICVEKIAGLNHVHPLVVENIPGCTYCMPQIASVGLTEAAAKEKGCQVKVGKFPAIGNGKAIALGEVEGFVKTVFDATTGELLGAHMIGAEVTELIQGYTIGKTAELIDEDFIQTVFPHPTLSEMMHEAVLAADGRVLHI